jgi:hypothetical protein
MSGVLLLVAAVAAIAPERAEASWLSTLLGLFHKSPASSGPVQSPAVTGALSVDAGAESEFSDLMNALWTRIRPQVEQGIKTGLAQQVGQKHGNFTIEKLDVTSLDLTRAPAVTSTPLSSGGTYTGERLEVQLPGDTGGWSLSIDGRVAYDVNVNLGFTTLSTTLHEDVGISVTQLRGTDDVDVDATDPGAPKIANASHPVLDFDLSLSTNQSIVNSVLSFLKPVIHLVLSIELENVFSQLDPLVNSVKGKPGAPWGVGGPGFTPFAYQPDLRQAALWASEDMMNDHTPFGTVYECDFSSPVYRQGTVTNYSGLGDSPIWTGSYLTGEALRFAATGDQKAEANAKKVVQGIKLLLDVQDPNSGRLSRYAVPLSDPFGQKLLPIGGTQWIATVGGQQYVCDENISRDQHDGVMMGLSVAYDYFTDPQLKQDCATLIQRIVDFLESTGWNALRRDGSVSAPFIQSPVAIVGFTAAAERTDPGKYSAMRTKHGRIAGFDWIGTWISTFDPLDSYFKWNLGHTTFFTAMRLETDPDRYRHLERSFTIMRRCVGHHRNSWFDGVEAALDPSKRATLGPIVTDDLRRIVWRGRRDRTVTNSTDPTIQQAQYTGLLATPLGSLSLFGQSLPLGTQSPVTVAKYPIPVEKRPNSDFLWQRNPFDLDGAGDPHHQSPGVDVILPYWLGRYEGFVP